MPKAGYIPVHACLAGCPCDDKRNLLGADKLLKYIIGFSVKVFQSLFVFNNPVIIRYVFHTVFVFVNKICNGKRRVFYFSQVFPDACVNFGIFIVYNNNIIRLASVVRKHKVPCCKGFINDYPFLYGERELKQSCCFVVRKNSKPVFGIIKINFLYFFIYAAKDFF
jgi:hypothetical protein